MKLWIKIFLSILMLSLTTLFISALFVINKSHISNIDREQERSLNEYELIRLSIQNDTDINTLTEDTVKTNMARYGAYYSRKNINLVLYGNHHYIYNDFTELDTHYKKLLDVTGQNKLVQAVKQNKNHYILVSGLLSEENNSILIYVRDINSIYLARYQSIRLSVLLGIILIILLGVFSYHYAKWITKPVETLHKGAAAISAGNYSVRIPETKDEFHDVVHTFNQMASAVETRSKELEDKAKERQVFIDDLSHEMNTPLTSIQGYAAFLLSANATEEQKRKAAGNIHAEAKRMQDMHTKLMSLTYAREHELELTVFYVNDLFADVKNTFYNQLKNQNVSFTMNSNGITLTADRTLVHMLLCNLVKNSLQVLPEGGFISLEAYEDNGRCVLKVTDTGEGIPADKINEVTKPFVRVDKSRSRKTGGAGLGLSICKNIALLHHADFIIESQPGRGTIIKIIF